MMRAFFLLSVFAFTAVTTLGCAPEATTPDGGGGGSGGSAAVTYTKNVQPIFAAKCAPCHTTQSSGGHNLGTTYADAFKTVQSVDAPAGCFKDGFDRMMPKTMGECALAAIMEGWMPMAMYCFNTPRPATCVSLEEQDVVAAWVAAGMPQ